VAAVLIASGATACFPPGSIPVEQSLPPGGRTIATGLPGAGMWIEDTDDDLSAVVYGQNYYTFPNQYPHGGRYWLYDDHAKASTLLPVREDPLAGPSGVGVGPDGRWVVFASPDPDLQVGPVERNCVRFDGLFQPMPAIYCAELYRYDLASGELTQLTGLGGSSEFHHVDPDVSADGSSVQFMYGPAIPEAGMTERRLDLATGVVEDLPFAWCCTWQRGTDEVRWDEQTGVLTSTDLGTGEVTTLFGGGDAYWYLAWSSDDGRFVVLSSAASPSRDIFRLVDTDDGSVREVPSQWISQDGSHYALRQQNVAPTGDDRLVLGPVQP
jgi:Tol biopolymer transport system component